MLGDRELQPRRRRGVRDEVAEAGNCQKDERKRQPRRGRKRGHSRRHHSQREGHAAACADDPPGERERGHDGPDAECADERPRPRRRMSERMRERGRLRVHRVGAGADARDDEQVEDERAVAPQQVDRVAEPRPRRAHLGCGPDDQERRCKDEVGAGVDGERDCDALPRDDPRRRRRADGTRDVERRRVHRDRLRHVLPRDE